jgi:hypothetical protein
MSGFQKIVASPSQVPATAATADRRAWGVGAGYHQPVASWVAEEERKKVRFSAEEGNTYTSAKGCVLGIHRHGEANAIRNTALGRQRGRHWGSCVGWRLAA